MARKKEAVRDKLLSKLITLRVTEALYNKLERLHTESSCASIGEVARKILSKEKIVLLHKDISMNGTMEELASIRKELRAIGVNINQITHHFHSCDDDKQKLFLALKTSDQYRQVDQKVEVLLKIISQIALKWLQ